MQSCIGEEAAKQLLTDEMLDAAATVLCEYGPLPGLPDCLIMHRFVAKEVLIEALRLLPTKPD